MSLSATLAGRYKIKPIRVTAGGKIYHTQPLQILVREIDQVSVPRGDKFIFVTIGVKPQSLYITETYTATLTIGIRQVLIDNSAVRMDLFRQVLDQRASEFSIFPGQDPKERRTETWIADSHGARHKYELLTLERRFRADEVGHQTVGPVFVKAKYPTKLRRNRYGTLEVAATARETDRAEAIHIEVLGPPEEGRPLDFAGAIGRYTMAVTARPNTVEQGQPVTLSIAIRGTPLQGLPGPDLKAQPELSSRFDFSADELVGDVQRNAKVFRRAIFPKQAGEQTIPPLRWSYFNPKTKRYATLTSKPIPLSVTAAPESNATISLTDETEVDQDETTLTRVVGGIRPNYSDIDLLLAGQTGGLTTGSWAALALAPAFYITITLVSRRRDKHRADAGFARRRRARRHAMGLLAKAAANDTAIARLHACGTALTTYLSDRFSLGAGAVTPMEAGELLRDLGVEASLAEHVVRFLETCDAACYATDAGMTEMVEHATDDVGRWISQIERAAR